MPNVDMPLEMLREYKGISPRPADFDAYWERALLLLGAQDMAYTLEPDDFTVDGLECAHLYYTGVGGARIHAKLVRPAPNAARGPALAMFHGYRARAGDWFDMLPYAYNGMTVAAMDVRGQAGLSVDTLQVQGNTVQGHIVRGVDEDDPQKLAYKFIYLDTVQLVRILGAMDGVDANRIGVTGASQGGGLALACAALEPRVKRVAACCPFLCDFQRVWEMGLVSPGTAYEELRRYFFSQDPLHRREERFWNRLGYLDQKNLAPRIRGSVQLYTGLADTMCPPSTQFAAYNAITAPKEQFVYPERAHEDFPESNDMILRFMRGL